ncbi:MAG: hypothetical protein A3H02_02785 [Candidatus Niyogibacteria bacterium RIFCSPLOWO2_12_FULL_41_13]|uniref:Uncharacterized protein n=1 Tax=Candidatus Niyogibacteria bacterium RIFCSPLOWO2_12_FULL_41_13 TaxID=1801726 RepID=A0A1G2F1A5_9BACT|nr:MAG: hypothetical protein A3H02_02785 [Candidatus Niyogibacteria bacterium RIFCSPLOWO2_12_FULL_41_13]
MPDNSELIGVLQANSIKVLQGLTRTIAYVKLYQPRKGKKPCPPSFFELTLAQQVAKAKGTANREIRAEIIEANSRTFLILSIDIHGDGPGDAPMIISALQSAKKLAENALERVARMAVLEACKPIL